jgi:hypothetical protein
MDGKDNIPKYQKASVIALFCASNDLFFSQMPLISVLTAP